MKPIETPAFRPTASCIWNAFRSSGKRHLLLTGGRGSGKTTLLSALCPDPLPGLTTWATPGTGVYLRENGTQLSHQIASFDPELPGRENKMTLLPQALSDHMLPILQRCLSSGSPWISIDEIGYLESGSSDYQQAISQLMKDKQLIAVIRKQDLPFLQQLLHHPDAFVVDLDRPFGNSGCVIMASGLGRRFGGNKLMADFHGAPMICRVLDATDGLFSRRVVVTRHKEVAQLCQARGVDVILHHLPHRSDTVRLGLQALEQEVEHCVFCSADQPLLRKETLASLVISGVSAPSLIWRCACNGSPGNPVLFPKWTFPQLCSLPDGVGGSHVIKKYPEQVRLVPVQDMDELKDVDTQEDLLVLSER